MIKLLAAFLALAVLATAGTASAATKKKQQRYVQKQSQSQPYVVYGNGPQKKKTYKNYYSKDEPAFGSYDWWVANDWFSTWPD